MTPVNIINMAELIGLDIIAITDHNSCRNVEAALRAAVGHNVAVIPGMEVTTREDVHIICLLPGLEQAMDLQEIVYAALPGGENRGDVFGRQLVTDATGNVIDVEHRLLLGSTSLSIDQIFRVVATLKGICIPAHIDRPNYSIISSLGFIPPDMDIRVVEISTNTTPKKAKEDFPSIGPRTIIQSSDAHSLGFLLGRQTMLRMAGPCFDEIKHAFYRYNGRKVMVIRGQPGFSP